MNTGDEIGVIDKSDVPLRIGDILLHNETAYDITWDNKALRVIAIDGYDEFNWRDGDWIRRVAKHCYVLPKD